MTSAFFVVTHPLGTGSIEGTPNVAFVVARDTGKVTEITVTIGDDLTFIPTWFDVIGYKRQHGSIPTAVPYTMIGCNDDAGNEHNAIQPDYGSNWNGSMFCRIPVSKYTQILRCLTAGGLEDVAREIETFVSDVYLGDAAVSRQTLVAAAQRLHDSDEVNIDLNAATSDNGDGSWVQAWVYVDYEEQRLADMVAGLHIFGVLGYGSNRTGNEPALLISELIELLTDHYDDPDSRIVVAPTVRASSKTELTIVWSSEHSNFTVRLQIDLRSLTAKLERCNYSIGSTPVQLSLTLTDVSNWKVLKNILLSCGPGDTLRDENTNYEDVSDDDDDDDDDDDND